MNELREELKEILKGMSKELEEMNGFSRYMLNRFISLCDKVEQHLDVSIRRPSKRVSKLLLDICFELGKSGNEDATMLVDRIDKVLSTRRDMKVEMYLNLLRTAPEAITKLDIRFARAKQELLETEEEFSKPVPPPVEEISEADVSKEK